MRNKNLSKIRLLFMIFIFLTLVPVIIFTAGRDLQPVRFVYDIRNSIFPDISVINAKSLLGEKLKNESIVFDIEVTKTGYYSFDLSKSDKTKKIAMKDYDSLGLLVNITNGEVTETFNSEGYRCSGISMDDPRCSTILFKKFFLKSNVIFPRYYKIEVTIQDKKKLLVNGERYDLSFGLDTSM